MRRFLARFRRDGRRFVLSMIAWILLPIVLVTVGHALEHSEAVLARWEDRLLGPYMIAVGSTFLVFPFATPLTNRWLGMRTSVLLVRGIGVAMSALGLWKLAESLL